jgi:hypothetical protein
MTEITQAQVDEWIMALRSGEYSQGVTCLYKVIDETPSYCCLGVYGVLNGGEIDSLKGGIILDGDDFRKSYLPDESMSQEAQDFFSTLNDAEKQSFTQIADIIETMPLEAFSSNEWWVYNGTWRRSVLRGIRDERLASKN